ncbi:unnamed protein product [Blepharisma stoltei]|uniref:Uncharacterized protein n=1 Tax=Blepharisma stoltei TaxID=1481888 RepID=A0AAU9ILT3_9CILI|nr:unnamed protein product [Blepharisma stoltei]
MRTWLLSNAKFRREFWNHFDNDGMRTTNNLEGYHHALNKLVGAAHPNIFKFIETIKNEQQIFSKVLANIAGEPNHPAVGKNTGFCMKLLRGQKFYWGEETFL